MQNKRKANGLAKIWQLQQGSYQCDVCCNGLRLKEFFQVTLVVEMNEESYEESATHFQKLRKK